MTGYETETKLKLSQGDFESLQEMGEIIDQEDQRNLYFDNNWELSKKSATFRIRRFCSSEDHPVITLKIPIPDDSGARRCLEVEETLTNGHREILSEVLSVDTDLPEEFADPLLNLGVFQLEMLDSMRTVRHHVRLFEGFVIEMDQVHFPGDKWFFEVEFESESPEEHKKVGDVIRDHAPSACPSEKSKYERFAEILTGTLDLRQTAG